MMKKKYIQPEIVFEPIESTENICTLSTNNESIGPGNNKGDIGNPGEGSGGGANDGELSLSAEFEW